MIMLGLYMSIIMLGLYMSMIMVGLYMSMIMLGLYMSMIMLGLYMSMIMVEWIPLLQDSLDYYYYCIIKSIEPGTREVEAQ